MGALIMVGTLLALIVLIVGVVMRFDPESRGRPVPEEAKARGRE